MNEHLNFKLINIHKYNINLLETINVVIWIISILLNFVLQTYKSIENIISNNII